MRLFQTFSWPGGKYINLVHSPKNGSAEFTGSRYTVQAGERGT